MEWEAKSRERDRTPPLTSRLSPSHFAPWAGLRPMRRYGRREEAGDKDFHSPILAVTIVTQQINS